MPDKKFDLGDYVEVKDRIARFYELFGQGRLVTGEVRLTNEPDGVPRVMVQAFAYRSPEDTHPGIGWSWMTLPGTTSYTKGSELENVETSAWGRAIGSLGILILGGIATSNEIQNKKGELAPEEGPPPDGSLIGIAEVGKVGSGADFELRQTPEGPIAAFRLKQGRSGFKVVAHGALALALAGMRPEGQQVKVWGSMRPETWTPEGSKSPVTYNIVDLERMEGPDFVIPAVSVAQVGSEVTPEEAAEILRLELQEAAAG